MLKSFQVFVINFYEGLDLSTQKITKTEILDFLRKHKPFFKERFDVDEVILFGYYARDEATEESDIDILIESKKKSFDALYDMKELLENRFKKKVDIMYRDAVRIFIMRCIKDELIYA